MILIMRVKLHGRLKVRFQQIQNPGYGASRQLLLSPGVLYQHANFLKLGEKTQLNYHIRLLPFMRAKS